MGSGRQRPDISEDRQGAQTIRDDEQRPQEPLAGIKKPTITFPHRS